jgi:hypothetical protein
VTLARAVMLAACLGLVAGCGGSSPDADSPKGKKADQDDEEEVSSKGKKWGGWRWKGKRNDCFFIFKNECFSSMKKACRRAKCGDTKCEHDDSAPAKVACKKSKKKG